MAHPKFILSAKQLELIKTNFNLLDESKSNKIGSEEFSILYRALGQTISEKDLQNIKANSLKERNETLVSSDTVKKTATNPPSITSKSISVPIKLMERKPTQTQNTHDCFEVSFERFINLFTSNYVEPISENVIREAFEVFDEKRTGMIKLKDFIDMMTKRGETLTKTEVDEVLKLANIDPTGGDFDYADFVDKLCNHHSNIQSI